MGVRSWLEKRKAKIASSGINRQEDTVNGKENPIYQHHQDGKSLNKALGNLGVSSGSSQKAKNVSVDDAPIRELWSVAYEKLREENSALVKDYEAKLTNSVAAGLGQTLKLKADPREWMQVILQSKMDEINKEVSGLKLDSFKAQARDVMRTVLDIVDSANDYISGAASANAYTSIAWTGVGFFLPLLMNISREQASIAKGLEYISSLIIQSRMREELYFECYESGTNGSQRFRESHVQFKTALEKLYRHILKFQATCCCYYAKNSAVRHGLDAVKWNDWAMLIDEIREQERNFTSIEEKWRDIQHFEERLVGINTLSAMNANLAVSTNQDFADLMQWLCAIDPSSMYNAARDEHETGTCEWLIKDCEEFKIWKASDRSLIWLHGKAGSGKSILISSVIKHLREYCATESSTVVSYFYFSFSDPEKQNVGGMLASLIKQICSQQPRTSQLIQLLQAYKIKNERPDTETLEAMLVESASDLANLYIVVDALDECPLSDGQRGKLLKSLQRILAIAPNKFHLFLTSRKEPDIEIKLRSSSSDMVEIDLLARQQIINKDIDHYIHAQLRAEDYNSWPSSVKEEARGLLLEKADCMFQYVRFQLEALRSLSSVADIRKALGDLPIGLDATYDRILGSIDPRLQEQVIHSLKWLAFPMRLVTIEELAEVFVIRSHDDIPFDEARRLFRPTDVLKYFPGLVVTQETSYPRGTKVRLVHFSLKEYLISPRIRQGPVSAFSFTEINAQLSIVQSSLVYLDHLINNHLKATAYALYPLVSYASYYWMVHLEKIPRASWPAGVTQNAMRALAAHSQSFLTLLILNRTPRRYLLKPHCFTASSGHLQLTEMLLSSEVGMNRYVMQEDLDEALQHAVFGEQPDVMQALLRAGADVNAHCGIMGSALQAAMIAVNPATLKFLVSHGADVTSLNKVGFSLAASLSGSNIECLEFLLDNGADINMKYAVTKSTLLHEAAVHLDKQHVDLLLDRGADVNALDGENHTPLYSMLGRLNKNSISQNTARDVIEIVERLLRSGANLNIGGGNFGTALQAACTGLATVSDHRTAEDMIRLLIDNGADVNIEGGEFGSAFNAAVAIPTYPERLHIMKLLLDSGATINNKCHASRGTALHIACSLRHKETVCWLLAHGADANANGGSTGTPLQSAVAETEAKHSQKDTLDIVELLVDNGAQVSQTGEESGNILETACCNRDNSADIILWLLEHGAEVNTKGGEYGSALAAAAYHNNTEIMRLLLERDADVNAKGGRYGTALITACSNTGTNDSVRLLIEHGADVCAEGEDHRTALTAACDEGVGESVRLLLEHGADVRHHNYAAWHAAAQNDCVDVMKLLLDHGVDVNHVNGEHGTALNATMEAWGRVEMQFIQLTEIERQNWQDRICLLLSHGADVDIKGGRYGFPLQTTCATEPSLFYHPNDINTFSGKTKFLLEQCTNINVNAQGGLFGSALQAAAFSGQTQSVRLLLDRQADVNARGGKYGSALNAAVFSGYWDIVEMLLQAGATPDHRLLRQPDDELLRRVEKERFLHLRENDGRRAVARYRKFWEVESSMTPIDAQSSNEFTGKCNSIAKG
ncbi:ankyrin repeat-containing domain protein [Trichoderma chlorosporum]